jgi:glycolate oxidase FAD binding subunit
MPDVDSAALDGLRQACGDSVRAGNDGELVDGVRPVLVASPRDAQAVSDAMTVAAEHRLSVVVRGNGSKLDWGKPPTRVDLLVDVSALDAVLEHAAGDLIVRVEPGVRLAALQEVLAPAGQRLAVEEVVPGSTIGGVIATALSGPSRMLYGAVRDLLIGVTVVRADGAFTRSGGRVVKNVAGYDLCKLYTGSYGTLGVITEAIFRLHPVPEAASYVSVAVADETTMAAKVAEVISSQLVPSAVEIDRPSRDAPITICVLVEGSAPGVAARAVRLASLLGPGTVLSADRPPWWGKLPPGATTLRVTAQLAGVGASVRAVTDSGLEAAVRGSGGSGVLHVGVDADPAGVARFLEAIRNASAAQGGSAVVLRAPAPVKAGLDVWGPIPAISLMRRVKDSFDPDRRLSPGRFVGGI